MLQKKSILIIESDETFRQTLTDNLQGEGYTVITAAEGQHGLELARLRTPDLIILDVVLPGLDGLSVCRLLRREMDVPIVILTARSGEVDKIVGLDSGADDYITKPFSVGEFLARVRAALRRQTRPNATERLESGNLSLDPIGRRAYKAQAELNLNHKEFDLLVELIRHRGVVLSRDLLLAKIWSHNSADKSRTIDVHIRRLREKIEDDPAKPKRIITIWGIGYRFEG